MIISNICAFIYVSHTHTHTHRERERETGREGGRESDRESKKLCAVYAKLAKQYLK